jgi:Transglycosylase SLT domain
MATLTCMQAFDLVSTAPTLPDAPSRLTDALAAVAAAKLDMPTLLFVIACRESGFDPDAVSDSSTATGLFQFLEDSANDVQDRVVKNFMPAGTQIAGLESGDRFVDHRNNPQASAFCAYAYVLDRIASRHGDVAAGLAAYGTGDDYATATLSAVKAVRRVAGLPEDQPTNALMFTGAAATQCNALKNAIAHPDQ